MQDLWGDFVDSWWPYVILLIVTVYTAYRFYVGGTYCDSPERIDGKNVIITGSSSGIGLETAKELAKRGGNLILAVRNGEKGLRAIEQIRKLYSDAKVTVKLLDVSEFTSIHIFVDQIKHEYEQIDILINNAGIICNSSRESLDENDLTYLTNYLGKQGNGPFLLTHLLLPLLKKSENGRVINVSAPAHFNGTLTFDNLFRRSFTPSEAYAESKLALTVFTKHMAQLNRNCNVTFNSVNPGLVRGTAHLDNYFTLGNSLLTKMMIWPWIWLFLKSPKQGSQTIIYLAVEPRLHKVSGYYFSDCEIKEPAEAVNDTGTASLLYERSLKAIQIYDSMISETIEPPQNIEEI